MLLLINKVGPSKTLRRLLWSAFIAMLVAVTPAQASIGLNNEASKVLINVTGTVRGVNGEALPGATVTIKGSETATVTDANGVFRLNLPTGNETLVIRLLGFRTQEVAMGGRTEINIVLETDNSDLEEVVVVGYGEQKREHLTGSVVSVDVRELEDFPVTNLGAALRGRLPGVGVSGGIGRPSQNATLTIREPLVLSKDGGAISPLYVIDDIIRTETDFNLLDPSEVESISILKDAAAAIYGARAGDGVVIVRTKRGHEGKPRINYNGSFGVGNATVLPTMMNGYEHARYLNTLVRTRTNFVAEGGSGYLNHADYYTPDELEHFRNNNYDWLDMAWKTSEVTRHAINVSGGSERATYFAGATYTYQNGNLENIDMDKWTFRASSDIKVGAGIKVGLSVSGDMNTSKMFLSKQGSENIENDIRTLLLTPQFTPPYINGLPVRMSTANGNSIENYHFFEVQRLDNYTSARNNSLNVVTNLEYDVPFIEGLKARVQFGKNFGNEFGKQYGTKYDVYTFHMQGGNNHIYTGDVNTVATFSNGNRLFQTPGLRESYQLNGFLNYARDFGNHSVSVLAAFEQSEFDYEQLRGIKEEVIPGGYDNIRFAIGNMDVYNNISEGGNLSYIGRANYSYADKYLAEFAFRYDASTNFAPENRWGFFPSMSLGWIISNEDFFDSNELFSFLKIRGSLGLMGGDKTKAYMWQQRYTFQPTGGPVFGGNSNKLPGMRVEAMPNYNVRWDESLKWNIGVDASFLNNRLSTVIDGWYDYKRNMLTEITSAVPLFVGSAMPSENYSNLDAYGFEFAANWNDRISEDFNYKIGGFLSWSDVKSLLIDVNKGFIGTYRDGTGHSRDRGLLGYHYLGMFRTDEDVERFLAQPGNEDYTLFGEEPKPGMLYYKDVRGPYDPDIQNYTGPDGKITEDDLDYLTPKESNHFGFGLSLGAGWKGFRIDAVMSGSFGGQGMIEGAARKTGKKTENKPAFWKDHWTPETPNATYPNPYYEDVNTVASSFWFMNSFSFRMRTLNLSYSISEKLASNLGVNGARVYLVANEPINFYNPYSYRDNYGSYDGYPNLRTFSLGINVNL